MAEIPATTGAEAAAQARPLAGVDPLKVDMATLVPPGVAALLDQLDNPSQAAQATPAPDDEDDVATLDFVGDELPEVVHDLRYPFNWGGVRRDTVTVRQLTTAQVGRISGEWQRSGNPPLLMDVYAVMTGLPARVLRALPHVDGDPIVRTAYDFLPPSYRGGVA